MWVNMARSSNSAASGSTFLSAIQTHLVFDRSMICCSVGVCVAAVLIVSVGGAGVCCASSGCKGNIDKATAPSRPSRVIPWVDRVFIQNCSRM